MGVRRSDLQAGGTEWLCELGPDELSHALAGHRPGEAGGEPAEGEGVVGGAAGRLGGRGGEAALHADVVEKVGGALGDRLYVVEASAVAEQFANRDPFLACGGKL